MFPLFPPPNDFPFAGTLELRALGGRVPPFPPPAPLLVFATPLVEVEPPLFPPAPFAPPLLAIAALFAGAFLDFTTPFPDMTPGRGLAATVGWP